MRLNLAQRVAIVAALGFALLALGEWIASPSRAIPRRVFSYSPVHPSAITPTELLVMWCGFAMLWAVASILILRDRSGIE